jgi:biopolymer transport protein ExbB
MWGEIALSLKNANLYIIIILIMGFLGTVVFFERLIVFQLVFHIDFGKFLTNLRKMITAEDLERAMAFCKSVSKTSLPRISLKALEAMESDPSKVRGVIEEETIEFLPNIDRRLGVLPGITLMIMLIGILGTIDSLWQAFHSIDVLDTAKKQATLAQGIAGALNPTAISMSFGILFLAAHYFLRAFANNLVDKMHHGVTVLINLLVPQESMTMVPMIASANSGPPISDPVTAPDEGPKSQKQDTNSSDENFDDVSVEDIKDEEEII